MAKIYTDSRKVSRMKFSAPTSAAISIVSICLTGNSRFQQICVQSDFSFTSHLCNPHKQKLSLPYFQLSPQLLLSGSWFEETFLPHLHQQRAISQCYKTQKSRLVHFQLMLFLSQVKSSLYIRENVKALPVFFCALEWMPSPILGPQGATS